VGAGMRGYMTKNLEYEVDWAMALNSTDKTQSNEKRIYFKVKTVF
jgi:hemolysin activation/secretion protein